MNQTLSRRTLPLREALVGTLPLLTLVGFFVAQPLFSLLEGYGEFFIARAAAPMDVLAFTALAIVLPSVVLVSIALCFALFGKRARCAAQTVLVVFLVFLGMLPLFAKLSSLSGVTILAGSLATGLAFGYCYFRFQALRTLLTYASPAIVIFPLAFIFTPDIRDIAFPPNREAVRLSQTTASDTPVVLIILDEFPVTSLMTKEHLVDPILFPNFARLADSSHWFRNATTVATSTAYSVPAILSGRYVVEGQPTLRDYPNNLLTMLGGAYSYNVYESVTKLCPTQFCGEELLMPFPQRMTALLVDVSIVYLHIVTPDDYDNFLPDISQGWDNFLAMSAGTSSGKSRKKGTKNLSRLDGETHREAIWRHFAAAIPDRGPSLNVLHSVFPHGPWVFLPSGKLHGKKDTVGLKTGRWHGGEWAVKQGWQRHLMQVVHADRLLGELFDELQSKHLFDKALIIVTADHGVSFKVGEVSRRISTANFMDILPVPLFVKTPGQQQGVISEENIEAVDVLPTILDVLGLKTPQSVEGFSVFDDKRRGERKNKRTWEINDTKTHEFPAIINEKYETLDEQLALFTDIASQNRLFAMGPDKYVVGQNVADLPMSLDDHNLLYDTAELLPGSNSVSGNISGIPPAAPAVRLALAVNDIIAAVTMTFTPNDDGAADFVFLVPESAYTDEENDMRIWVKGSKGWSPLERLDYTLVDTNGQRGVIMSSDGMRFSIVPGAVVGKLGRLKIESDFIRAEGWAADVSSVKPAKMVILFVDGKFVSATAPELIREGVARKLGSDDYLKSGFRLTGPGMAAVSEVAIFGLSHNGTASALKVKPSLLKSVLK